MHQISSNPVSSVLPHKFAKVSAELHVILYLAAKGGASA